MARPKKKPDYDAVKIMQDFTDSVVDCFGRRYDDRIAEKPGVYPSLNAVAAEFNITVIKTRKILITAGYYSTAAIRKVAELNAQGLSVQEIMEATGLKYAAVQAYMPYSKSIYKLDELSTNAERTRLYRQRKDICRRLGEAEVVDEAVLWEAVVAFQNYPFHTISGLPFSYVLKIGRDGTYNRELIISRRKESKTLAWSSVMLALHNAQELRDEVITRPKDIGDIRGISYIYAMFLKFQIIRDK
jgi:hypothetical protein